MPDDMISGKVVEELKKRKLKIAAAESITGGLVASMITSVSGASEIFECGVCCYSNRIKNEVVGVPDEILEKYTEYSIQTAEEMAKGIQKLSGADIGVSTTGIAGPSGGTEKDPVGTVYVGFSSKDKCFAVRLSFDNSKYDRNEIRRLSAEKALEIVLGQL